MAAICRFGMRVVPNISEIITQCRNKKQLVQGPHIAEFEQEFLRVLGGRGHVRAVSTEYGRMALYFILKALDIPAGSEDRKSTRLNPVTVPSRMPSSA